MAVFRYVRDGRAHSLSFVPPARIPDLLRQAGLAFDFPCGGRGACLKCRARLTGAVSPMDAREESLLSGAEHAGGVRFLCMATALGDCEAVVDPAGDEAVETGAPERFSPQPWGRTLGAAFDLGTTTTAGALYSLETGRRLATAGMRNPQRAFGADVMSRLDAAEAGRGDALGTGRAQRPARRARRAVRAGGRFAGGRGQCGCRRQYGDALSVDRPPGVVHRARAV